MTDQKALTYLIPPHSGYREMKFYRMAQQVKKSEHSGSKKGRGAYWGRKKDAKTESNRLRREIDKNEEKPVSEKDER
jgi:hypothetical protein